MALKTYDFKNWLVTVAGQKIEGFDDDEGFTIEWDEDFTSEAVGADGRDVTRNILNNQLATLTIKLKQTSHSNTTLKNVFLADRAAPVRSNAQTVVVSVLSLSSGATYGGNQCWIKKPPSITGGKEAGMYEWPIRIPFAAVAGILGEGGAE